MITPKPLRQVEKLVETILHASISSGKDIEVELLALATLLGLAFTKGWLFFTDSPGYLTNIVNNECNTLQAQKALRKEHRACSFWLDRHQLALAVACSILQVFCHLLRFLNCQLSTGNAFLHGSL